MQNVESELNYLKTNWKRLLWDMSQKDSRSLAFSILRSAGAQLIKLEDNVLTIAFRNQMFVDKLSLPENGLITKEVIEKALGHAIGLEFIVGDFRTPEEKQQEETAQLEREKAQEVEREKQHILAVKMEWVEMQERWADNCGIPPKFCGATFDNYDSSLQKKTFETIKKYITSYYNEEDNKSMVMYSDGYGVGKTHLVSAIGNYIMEKYPGDPLCKPPCPILFVQENDLLRRIKATYDHRDYGETKTETEIQVFNNLKNVKLLIIDDVGKELPADPKFCQRVYFSIINSRYNAMKPIILTSNLNPGKLAGHIGDAAADRLVEMCGEYIIELTGKSYRTRKLG